jgi:hypothetical protein
MTSRINAVLLDADERPGAVKLTGIYQVIGTRARVRLALRKDQTTISNVTVEELKNDIPGLVEKLTLALGAEIEKLLPR